MFSVGEFSRVTGITVKALRLYHEQQLLIPSHIDPQTGYRYYHESLIERARAIVYLRNLELPIEQIKLILNSTDDDHILTAMQSHQQTIEARIRELCSVARSLEHFISQERRVSAMTPTHFDVQEKSTSAMLIAGIRMKGHYSECGKGFSKIFRSFGRFVSGPPMMLHYDTEYKENDADFEACIPVKQSKTVEGINVRELPAMQCVTLVHKGPYEKLSDSYAKVFKYVNDKGYIASSPTREIYIKGPGMIFRGNPKNYLTEIQIPVQLSSAG
ncbi:MAG TPA: MerR family transcriptional regulator [Tepidisphaeraceae bacterium]|nr:MerR family transcriptional regulator [Tepidisphaeraceae bacterium]